MIFDSVLSCDMILLASPIYSWYCTAPMKAVLDRLVYGLNKYYGEQKGPSLWAGKKVALITTCGYSPDKGADIWEEGITKAEIYGTEDSYFHMSPVKGDSSQGTSVDIPEISKNRYFLHNKKILQALLP